MIKAALTKKLAFIGGGQMAEALVGGLVAAELCDPATIWATDPLADRAHVLKSRFGILVGEKNAPAVEWADVIVLAVKPQILPQVLSEIGAGVEGKLVISIAAGVSIAWIRQRIPHISGIIRAMPNVPALVREGVTAIAIEPGVQETDATLTRTLFGAVGRVVSIEEHLMDAVTGLSGSGPAYIFVAIEALADGGVKMGLPRQTAELLAAQTVLGAAKLVLEKGEHPARLKDQVASPGGTTIAGLHRLEAGSLRATLIAAVEAATRRSEELGRTCL
ncbi:MAG: pyrroline-5-carboxylate reductase [Nitrospiraceae bacterium]